MTVGFRTSIANFSTTFFSSFWVVQFKEGPYIYQSTVKYSEKKKKKNLQSGFSSYNKTN